MLEDDFLVMISIPPVISPSLSNGPCVPIRRLRSNFSTEAVLAELMLHNLCSRVCLREFVFEGSYLSTRLSVSVQERFCLSGSMGLRSGELLIALKKRVSAKHDVQSLCLKLV